VLKKARRRSSADIVAVKIRVTLAHGIRPPNKLQVSAKATAPNKPGKKNSGRLNVERKGDGSQATTAAPTKINSAKKKSRTTKLSAIGS
jgi:hypothetical protein